MKKRVGIIALLHESNTFLERPTELKDFEANLLCTGEEAIRTSRGTQHEVGGFIAALESADDVDLVGIFAGRAMPYGPIPEATWETLMAQMLDALNGAGKLDGLLVAPHGATVAENALDADGDWLNRVRQTVGPEMPIIGTLDLHANVTPLMVESCDALFGYRTNPHLDQRQRGIEAGELMLWTLRGGPRPKQALVQLPMCVNIERQATEEPHGKKLWAEADRLARETLGVLKVSCLYGFPYADVSEMGGSVIVVTDGNKALAEQTAKKMARFWWEMREEFVGQMISVDEAIVMANEIRQQDSKRPVGLLDMGDNVGGGSAADGTIIVEAWLRSGRGNLLAIFYDPEVVQQAEKSGVGARLKLRVGGKTDQLHGKPIEGEFTVLDVRDGAFHEPEARHGGYNNFDQGRTAILRSENGLTVMATSLRMPPLSLQQVLAMGLKPEDYAAIAIKGAHAPVAAYAPVCSRLIRVNTPGTTCADPLSFQFKQRRVPMYPFEECEFGG